MADWQALARAVQQARARFGMSQGDLAARVGVSVKTINNIENGRHEGMRPTTRHKLETALGWHEGSVHDVLAGGEPTTSRLLEEQARQRLALEQGGGDGDVTEENSGREVQVDRGSVGADEQGREPYLTRREGPPTLPEATLDELLEEVAKRARASNPDADR